MSTMLQLQPEVEALLRSKAARHRQSLEDYLLDLVAKDERSEGLQAPVSLTPVEILAHWEQAGVHAAAPGGPDSPVLARQWRKQAERRNRESTIEQHSV